MNFTNLPQEETILRAALLEPVGLTFESVYTLRDQFREANLFESVVELDSMEAPPGLGVVSIGPGHFTGVHGARFVGNPSGVELRLQSQLISVRWHNGSGHQYPRFSKLIELFAGALERLSSLLLPPSARQSGTIPLAVVNMGYSNFVTLPPGVSVTELLCTDFCVPAYRSVAVQKIHNLALSWQDDAKNDLRLDISRLPPATSQELNGGPYRLTTVAGRHLAPSAASPVDAFNDLHQRLLDLFKSVLSEKAKSLWGYSE